VLANILEYDARKAGIDPDITPKSHKALKRFKESIGKEISTSELDILRKVAQNAARAKEPADAAIGVAMINNIDDFLDNIGNNALKIPGGKSIEIGKKYKIARDLWGRARKSELLQESFEKARNQASGFENGVRTQFRSILNNKKQRKFFNKDELKAMETVVRGDTKQNIAKLIGRLGFGEGQATNIVGAAIGSVIGANIFGPGGVVIVPLVGQVSRKLAQRMTVKGAEFADDVIRAGKDAKRITAAYLKNTPEALRSSEELSQLLLRTDIALKDLPNIPLANDARRIAIKNRAALAGTLAPQALKNEQPIR